MIGATIPHSLLRVVSELDENELSSAIVELEDAGFLYRTYEEAAPAYCFKHILTQDAAYRSVPRNIRAKLHTCIAEILEDQPSVAATSPGLLALHHERAGNIERAIAYYRQAGRAAYLRSANEESVDFATRGVKLLGDLASGSKRDKTELSLQLTLAPALVAARGYGADEVKPAYKRAELLSGRLDDVQQSFRALVGLWNFHWVRGELDTAHQVAARLLTLAKEAEDPGLQLRSNAAMGEILFHLGNLEDSLSHLQFGLSMRDQMAERSRATQIPEVACLCYAAWTHWHIGDQQRSRVMHCRGGRACKIAGASLQHCAQPRAQGGTSPVLSRD